MCSVRHANAFIRDVQCIEVFLPRAWSSGVPRRKKKLGRPIIVVRPQKRATLANLVICCARNTRDAFGRLISRLEPTLGITRADVLDRLEHFARIRSAVRHRPKRAEREMVVRLIAEVSQPASVRPKKPHRCHQHGESKEDHSDGRRVKHQWRGAECANFSVVPNCRASWACGVHGEAIRAISCDETWAMCGRVRGMFTELEIGDLEIEDEASFRHVALYADLKDVLRKANYKFRVMAKGRAARWDRAVFLNLTFWEAGKGGDVLVDEYLPADVVTHVAWHHLASAVFPSVSADALLFGEAIASAFDLYLVGRLLANSPDSSFLATQVPAMSDAADLPEHSFEKLLDTVASDPERAFEDLRELLFDVTTQLVTCKGVDDASVVLERHDAHRFAPLLHHYELSNWILASRAHARDALAPDPAVRALDRTLREQKVALDWLETNWVRPSI